MTEPNILLEKARESAYLLHRAEKYIEEAEQLPDGDEKKAWLEQEAAKLIEESRALSREVQNRAGAINSKMKAAP